MDEIAKNLKDRITKAVTNKPNTIERDDLTKAAVLVPIVFRECGPKLIVTKRTMEVATHKGQISFPGGHRDPEDNDAIETALREAHEEIGLSSDHVEVVGQLDDSVTITKFLITPVVGFVSSKAKFEIHEGEVAQLIEAPFEALLNPQNYEYVTCDHEGVIYNYHQYHVGEHLIWGATARIIHRLLEAIK